MQLGILPIHSSLHHPQTQGKDESFNRSLTRECLKRQVFSNQEEARIGLEEYRNFYNEVRPHHALNLDTPAQHYRKSNREYPGMIREWEYAEGQKVLRVHGNGYFKYGGHVYYIGEAFLHERVLLRPSHKDGYITIEYRNFRVARINLETKQLENRRAYLLRNDPRNR